MDISEITVQGFTGMMKNKNGTKIPEKRFLFVHSKRTEKKKTLISQGFLGGSGDRIRTNDTPGMNRML